MSGGYTAAGRRHWLGPATLAGMAIACIPFDGRISRVAIAAKEHVGGDIRRALETWQQFGDLSTVIFVMVLIGLLDTRRLAHCMQLAIGAVLTFLIVQGLKMGIGRPRPRFEDPGAFLFPWGTYELDADIGPRHAWEIGSGISSDLWSMPSGHTAAAVVLGIFLVWLYPKLRPLASMLVGIVGLSRVLLGAHYPSDVLMGAAIAWLVCGWIFPGCRVLDEAKTETTKP